MASTALIGLACLASLASCASGIKTREISLASASRISGVDNWPDPSDPNAQPFPGMQVMLDAMKARPHDADFLNLLMPSLAIAPQWWVEQQGGYDVLIGAARYFYGQELLAATEAEKERFASVGMRAWIGLSDQSHTQRGAAAICNYGGPGQGLQFMLDQLKAHNKIGKALFMGHLSIAYEIMQVINGCLMWDGDSGHAYSKLLAKGGYMSAALQAMSSESHLRGTQSVGCIGMNFVLDVVPSAIGNFDAEATDAAKIAIEQFSSYDPNVFAFNQTWSEIYPVKPECTETLEVVSQARSIFQDGSPLSAQQQR